MSSRFLSITVLILATLCAASPLRAKTLLKVQTYVSSQLPGLGSNAKWLADKVKVVSDGQMRLKLYEPGRLVPATEILPAVAKGQIDAGFTTAGFASGLLGAKASLFSSIPFGPNVPEYLAWIYHGGGRDLWQGMYDQAGLAVHTMPCGVLPPETSGWFREPLDNPQDFNGLRIRFFGLGALVLEKLGASTSLLPAGEVFGALEKGAIDATEFSMPSLDERLGFHKILKYNYFPGWHQPATLLELIVHKDTWEGLKASERELLEMGCQAALVDGYSLSESIQFVAMEKNLTQRKVQNRYWSPAMLALFEEKWQEVISEQKSSDPGFAHIWDSLATFRKGYKVWNHWAFLPRPGTKREPDLD